LKPHPSGWFLLLFLLCLPGIVVGYPDREQLRQEMERLAEYLLKAQAAEGPECAPESLAAAQSHLARAREEFQEGDLWEAEDAIRLCEKEAEGIWEEVLVCKRDLDRDGIPGRKDQCPEAPETFNNYMDEDGCPDRVPRKAVLTGDRIEILVPIVFDQETQQPLMDADSPLGEVARIMEENPILRFTIQVHLAGGVPPAQADRITELRANHVKSVLVGLGIADGRLEAQGKGSREPIASNDSSWGRKLNDRVEFIRTR
jgi:outer membrane protein OmpA-like peptidoglycan-associated protein